MLKLFKPIYIVLKNRLSCLEEAHDITSIDLNITLKMSLLKLITKFATLRTCCQRNQMKPI